MRDNGRDRTTESMRGEIWELGYVGHPMHGHDGHSLSVFGMVRRMDGDIAVVIPVTTDETLQNEDSVIIARNWPGFPVIAWPRMTFCVNRRHMIRRIGRLGFRTDYLQLAEQSAVTPPAPHSKAAEGMMDLFSACLLLNEDALIHARIRLKRLEAMHAMAAGM